jgi:hypothetical protein
MIYFEQGIGLVRQDQVSKDVQFNLHNCSGDIVEVGLGLALSLSFTYICGHTSGSGIGHS